MGNTPSIADARDCLVSAVDGNSGHVAFSDQLLYQSTAVHVYNLNVPVTPAAVTFPQSAEQIAAIVKCASDYDYKVQARSGGHSFGNYGAFFVFISFLFFPFFCLFMRERMIDSLYRPWR